MYHSEYYFKKSYSHVLMHHLNQWDTPFSYIFLLDKKHNAVEFWVVKFKGVLFFYPNE
jgi:hypothetical protein